VAVVTNLITEPNSDLSMEEKDDAFCADRIHLGAEKDINLSSYLSIDSHALFLVLMSCAIIVRMTGTEIEMGRWFGISHINFLVTQQNSLVYSLKCSITCIQVVCYFDNTFVKSHHLFLVG
jgi:hypothetical protein